MSEHVAWCRYVSPQGWPTRIALCDSDSPGAFKVYHERELKRVVDALVASENLMHKAHQDHSACEQRAAGLYEALNICLGHMTGGMDGDWRNCDPVEFALAALRKARGEE